MKGIANTGANFLLIRNPCYWYYNWDPQATSAMAGWFPSQCRGGLRAGFCLLLKVLNNLLYVADPALCRGPGMGDLQRCQAPAAALQPLFQSSSPASQHRHWAASQHCTTPNPPEHHLTLQVQLLFKCFSTVWLLLQPCHSPSLSNCN